MAFEGAWITFGIVLAILIAVDLIAHRGEHGGSRKAAIAWSLVWVAVGLGFGVYVWMILGGVAAQEYFGAYLIEKSLSVDNLFVFLLIFQNLAIPQKQQHRVLIWGIAGALVFRAIFIFIGIAALERIEILVYVFGAVLLWAAYRVLREDPRLRERSKIVDFLCKHLPVTPTLRDGHFMVREGGRWMATPLFLAVIALETTDIVFAIDSIPAALSITRDPFIVYTSNAFAILGLRALYIVLADLVSKLEYLHYGLAFVLAFAAFKLLVGDHVHIEPWLSIAIIAGALVIAIAASLIKRWRNRRRPPDLVPGEPDARRTIG